MKTTHCSNLLKYCLMVRSFLLIFACLFPFYQVDLGNDIDTAAVVNAEISQPMDSSDPTVVRFNGNIGVLNTITGSTGLVKSGTLSFYTYVLLFIPVVMFVMFFLWRWVSDTVTGIIVAILAVIEFVFSILVGGAATSAFNAAFPALAQYDPLSSTTMLTVTTVASVIIFVLSIYLTLWNKIYAVKKSPAAEEA